jgi:Ca2+-binding EF-hand superfamily protein
MGGEDGEEAVMEEGDQGGAPGAAEGEEVTAEAEGPEGGSGEEQGASPHAEGAGGEAQAAATKKPPPVQPAWRRKRPNLLGSRVKEVIERNFEQAEEAFQSIDINLDGKISMRELRAALVMIDSAYQYTDEELNRAIMIADADGSGSVDSKEFMAAFCPHELSKGEVQDGLHNIGRTADGRKLAYLSLAIPSINLNGVGLLREYSHLRFMDVSDNKLTDLSPLGCLPYLLALNASNNLLRSVLDFKAPLCLREANFSNNRITAMNPLAAHRFLEELNLSGNKIRVISGVRDNVALRKLILDKNNITAITNLGDLPLRHLSLAENGLTAVNSYAQLPPELMAIMSAFEETYEEMELAFHALDANADNVLNSHELWGGLQAMGIQVTQETAQQLIGVCSCVCPLARARAPVRALMHAPGACMYSNHASTQRCWMPAAAGR